ncbi:MAG: ribbon-helix-helix domain-containing protein [Cetobacterium sp.]
MKKELITIYVSKDILDEIKEVCDAEERNRSNAIVHLIKLGLKAKKGE